MKAPGKPARADYDDVDLMNGGDLDLEDFIEAMEEETSLRDEPRRPKRADWRRIEELKDARWLRQQLDDWDDWIE